MLKLLVMALVVAVVFGAVILWRMAQAWLEFRGKRAIACPENHLPAGVRIDAAHAAKTAAFGAPDLRLAQCSRWPEKEDCGQDCIFQIERAPADCLVRNILAHWYEGKNCVSCGRPVGEIHWDERKPAVLTADRTSVEWNEIPAEKLQEILAGAQPICFSCHIANKMVREHPELVINRSRKF